VNRSAFRFIDEWQARETYKLVIIAKKKEENLEQSALSREIDIQKPKIPDPMIGMIQWIPA